MLQKAHFAAGTASNGRHPAARDTHPKAPGPAGETRLSGFTPVLENVEMPVPFDFQVCP
jgi:hypothetical protein